MMYEEFRARRTLSRTAVRPLRPRIAALYVFLFVVNVAAAAWAFILLSGDSVKLGTALLSYSLGLRHAVDADHIAATSTT